MEPDGPRPTRILVARSFAADAVAQAHKEPRMEPRIANPLSAVRVFVLCSFGSTADALSCLQFPPRVSRAHPREVNSNLSHPYSALRRRELLGTGSEKQDPIFAQFSFTIDMYPVGPSDIRALWVQIRVFGQKERETEKKHDCVAEEGGFEPPRPFRA